MDSEQFPGLKAVSVRRMTRSESDAYLAELTAKAWPDNKKWASGVRKQIKTAVLKQVPLVQAAVVAAHEKFELQKVIESLQTQTHALDAYKRFQRCRSEYESWQDNRGFGDPCDAGGIPHPSWIILGEMADRLRERGFKRNGLGWFDGAGASLDGQSWVGLKMVRGKQKWIDPAGILEVRSRFDAMFRTLLLAAKSSKFSKPIAEQLDNSFDVPF